MYVQTNFFDDNCDVKKGEGGWRCPLNMDNNTPITLPRSRCACGVMKVRKEVHLQVDLHTGPES